MEDIYRGYYPEQHLWGAEGTGQHGADGEAGLRGSHPSVQPTPLLGPLKDVPSGSEGLGIYTLVSTRHWMLTAQ